jgi:nuclear mRNA export protein SAC3
LRWIKISHREDPRRSAHHSVQVSILVFESIHTQPNPPIARPNETLNPTSRAISPNPFLSDALDDGKWAKRKRKNQFPDASDAEARKNGKGPWKTPISHNGNRKYEDKGPDSSWGKKVEGSEWGQPNGRNTNHKMPPPNLKGANPFSQSLPDDRPGSSSSSASTDPGSTEPHISETPYAQRIYAQLERDAIRAPRWPDEAGNPKKKAEMAAFRESYKKYRDRARVSLINSGLIDDPDKPKRLEDAIDFKGICEEMCPDFEKITRITEFDVTQAERDSASGWTLIPKMVKKLARSAAGQEAPLPMDVRSTAALKKTLDYLIDDLLRSDGNLPAMHGFLWDRTRAIRRDFVFHSTMSPDEMKEQVYCLETITRFHVTSLHLLAQKGFSPEDYDEHQEVEQLSKALLSLMFAYDDCKPQGVLCENEAEFRAYHLLFSANQPNIVETVQKEWDPRFWEESDDIRTAVSLVEALKSTQEFHGPMARGPSLAASSAYQSYFRIVKDVKVSYTMACFAEVHFGQLRRSILRALVKAFRRGRTPAKDITPAVLNRFLHFDAEDEAIDFVEFHGLSFIPEAGLSYLDTSRNPSSERLKHPFSKALVESKRSSHKLPDVIHRNVYLDPSQPQHETPDSPDSLFVAQTEPQKNHPKQVRFVSNDNIVQEPRPPTTATTLNGFPSANGSSAISSKSPTPAPLLNPFAPSNSQPGKTTSDFSLGFPSQGPAEKRATPTLANPFAPTSSLTPTFPGKEPAKQATAHGPNPSPSTKQQTPPAGQTGTQSAQAGFSLPGTAPAFSFSSAPASTPPQIDKIPSTKVIPPSPWGPQTSASPSGLKAISGEPSGGKFPPRSGPLSTSPQISLSGQGIGKQPLLAFPSFQTAPSASIAVTPQGVLANQNLHPPKQTPDAKLKATPAPPAAAVFKPVQKKDLMGDFAKWFVKGDHGLMEEFEIFVVDMFVRETFEKFHKDEQERKQKEADEKNLAAATDFRSRTLSVRYFTRWREIVRAVRLSRMRRAEREKVKEYYEKQRAATILAQKKAERRARLILGNSTHRPSSRDSLASMDSVDEFRGLLKSRKEIAQRAEDALLASGILSGVPDERRAIANIVRDADTPASDGRESTGKSSLGQKIKSGLSRSVSMVKKGGAKTQALREQFSSSTFRRSMPPPSTSTFSSRSTPQRQQSPHVSKVSDRWRLKARGLVTMPDGTALPESIAIPMIYENKRYPGLGSFGLPSVDKSASRVSASDADPVSSGYKLSRATGFSQQGGTSAITTAQTNGGSSSPVHKRKRSKEDDEDTEGGPSKRVWNESETQKMLEELKDDLRAMREQFQEGEQWFKQQNDTIAGELASRGVTPWGEEEEQRRPRHMDQG